MFAKTASTTSTLHIGFLNPVFCHIFFKIQKTCSAIHRTFTSCLYVLSIVAAPFLLHSQVPFTCEDQFFLTLGAANSSLNEVVIDAQSGSVVFQSINNNIPVELNAAGYRSTDNFIYCLNPDDLQLLRLDANGSVQVLATLPLNPLYSYFAGDITPDGRYLVLIGSLSYNSGGGILAEIVRVDLEDPNYGVTRVGSNTPCLIFDIAFHPETDVLYGYDSFSQRLVRINPLTGEVAFPFPSAGVPVVTGSLFFDAFGRLFAYGSRNATDDQNSLYEININSGASKFLIKGQNAESSDGCSCPYTILLSKSVLPEVAPPCSEVEYTFKIVNSSRRPQTGIRLEDNLPPGFTFVAMSADPTNGTLLSVPGDTKFILDNMSLPSGTSDVKIRVYVSNVRPRIYRNQAVLKNLPGSLGNSRLSDNLETVAQYDSTEVRIVSFSFDTMRVEKVFCDNTGTLRIDASEFSTEIRTPVTYFWEDASTLPYLDITSAGQYEVLLVSGCDSALVLYNILESSITVDVVQDLYTIQLGDLIELEATVVNSGQTTNYTWLDPEPGSVKCLSCAITNAMPLNDVRYTIVVQNEDGCQDSTFARVQVIKNRAVAFPNVFTPNGQDEVNGYFFGTSKQGTTATSFAVYSRWGEKMFEGRGIALNDPFSGWDGTFRGKDAQPGVYVWVAQLVFLDGETVTYSGDVTLIR